MAKSVHSKEYRLLLTRLRRVRLESGLTQVQVAKLLRKPQSFLSKCEAGERRLDVLELQKLARIYKKPLSFFLPKDW
jgi:transcriptional regulator with XRE-family HTH domain